MSESVWIGHDYPQFAGGERATYWLNGQVPSIYSHAPRRHSDGALVYSIRNFPYPWPQVPLHHLLANADPRSPEALRTGKSVDQYMRYIVEHQGPSGWLGPLANGGVGLFWARYYLLYAFANRAEATNNSTLREESISVMLRHVHASARLMSVPDKQGKTWFDRDGGWGTWRMHGERFSLSVSLAADNWCVAIATQTISTCSSG